jgi:DNA repair exonuclease SbcCD ATPase subunit
MKWKTFQSTVLLRQGEADVFLKAKAAERRERLMELIDLTFYKKLGQAAARHLKDWKEERDDWQNRIDEMEGISDEELVEHEQLVETWSQIRPLAVRL